MTNLMDRQTKLIVFFFCLIKLSLHLIADYHSGFQGDELMHIETGNHLAFGYMEFPPLISIVAFIQNVFNSDSVFVHHLFPHLCSILIMFYVAKIVLFLGGKEKALILALLAIIIAPGFERSQQLFQPVVFSQLFWTINFYYFLVYSKTLENKNLWLLTIFSIIGFLFKYDSLFFIFGLSGLLFFKKTRNALIQQKFWKNILVFLLAISPNIIWQFQNNFPFFQMMHRLKETQLEKLNSAEIITALFISINPLNSIFILLPAILFFILTKEKFLKIIGVGVLLSFMALLINKGKAYYFYPIILTLIPFGAVFWQIFVFNKKRWIFYPLTIILLFGAILIPFGMPVYSLNKYIQRVYPYEKLEIEGGSYGIKFDEYYSDQKWEKTLSAIKTVYDSLPSNEKTEALIWAKHYSQAGILKLKKEKYNLPNAFSYHGSFYIWSPNQGEIPKTIIAFRESKGNGKSFFEPYFESVIPVKTIYNPYAKKEDELYQTIFICKQPKQDFKQLKQQFSKRIFE